MKEIVTIEYFSEVLDAYQQGNCDAVALVRKFDELLSGTDRFAANLLTDLQNLISHSKLPGDLSGQLLDLTSPKTRLSPHIQNSSNSETDADGIVRPLQENHDVSSHPSTLLRNLSQWDAADQQKKIQPKQVIRGTYRLQRKVGVGGMGEVWKAVDLIQDAGETNDKYVAIKFISHEIRSHPYALKALVREFARYKKLIHPNIVKAYELNRDESEVFMVMEFLQGISLKKFIRQHPDGASLTEAEPIIQGMCNALNYAHDEGIVHLDFKPANIYYNAKTHVAKVIDFGIARLSSREDRDKTRFDPGNLGAVSTAYASCEMLLREDDPDPRDDIYGLTCVVYELLSGQHPFNGDTAIKAERHKMLPKPLKGLSKSENEVLAQGLKFHRKERIKTANEIYTGLYSLRAKATAKPPGMSLLGAALAIALGIISVLFYRTYDSWNLLQISKAIEAQEISGIEQFQQLSTVEQSELLANDATRLALVKFALSDANPDADAIRFLRRFNPKTEELLLKDRQIKQLLKSRYIAQINQAIAQDEFNQAASLAEIINEVYPDSKSLSEQLAMLEPRKKQRQSELENRYQRCINDQQRTLHMLMPCLLETRITLAKMAPLHPILQDPRLQKRISREAESALANKDVPEMEQLLADWRKLITKESAERQKFAQALDHEKEVSAFAEKVIAGSMQEMENILMALAVLDSRVKQSVMRKSAVLQKLLDYQESMVESYIQHGDYQSGFEQIDSALKLLSGNKKQTKRLHNLKLSITQRRSKELKALARHYDSALHQAVPDVKALQKIYRQTHSLDPKNPLLEYPEVAGVYAKLIEQAIKSEQFTLAQDLLDQWLLLRPKDAQDKHFIALSQQREAKLLVFQKRNKIERQLQKSIEQGQLNAVNNILEELQNNLSEQQRIQLLENLQTSLVAFYQSYISSAIQQNDYTSAAMLADIGLAYYPRSTILKTSKNQIYNAKQQRMKTLSGDFQQALNAPSLVSKEIFFYLEKIKAIDPTYLDHHPGFYNDMKARLLELAKTGSSLRPIQATMQHWEKFISADHNQQTRKIFQETSNLLALRCLYTGRKLKQQGKLQLADEFLMFGLSLNPINTVSMALTKELSK